MVCCDGAQLLAADRKSAELIASTAQELGAPAIVMGRRALSGVRIAVVGCLSPDGAKAHRDPVAVV